MRDPSGSSDTRQLWIGLDTGGTYTDAVALDGERRILTSAKALTTRWDLSVGIAGALRAVLDPLGADARAQVSLVCVSTTLATNAVVEHRFSPTCTVLIGFDDAMVERSGLVRAGGALVRVRGGHDATGEATEPLDLDAIEAAVREYAPRVEAFAVAGSFSVRNPAHELQARERIRALCPRPVTCAHELSSELDAPRRALTGALNARLTPQIRHLIEALTRVLESQGISAPLMMVKGDGTLMHADLVLEYPVETVLSGPAASVVGAGFLTGLTEFAVADMGGTTTDVAIVHDSAPALRAEGALVGGWRTMVEAVDVRTRGLGGDSEVGFDRDHRLTLGPRKVMPLSLLAVQDESVLPVLRTLAAAERLPAFAAQFARRNPAREPPQHAGRLERRIWDSLGEVTRPVSEVARYGPGIEALRRLADGGFVAVAGFTPSDAMHVLGRQHDWCTEAAVLGASILGLHERNATGRREADSAERMSTRIYDKAVQEAARSVLDAALAHDPGIESSRGSWGRLGDAMIEEATAGRSFSRLLDGRFKLSVPLVAIGAPAAAYYPEVARRLGASLVVPEHAAVCNAIGAVAGVVSERCDVLVNQTALKVFRVHDPAGFRDYPQAEEAIADARRIASERALQAARRAGAADPHVETQVIERRAHSSSGEDYLAEALVRSTATGRPAPRPAGRQVLLKARHTRR